MIMNDIQKEFYSVAEFAKKIGKHPISVRRAIKSKRINAIRIGLGKRASYSIHVSEIERVSLCDLEEMVEKMIEIKMNGKK